MKPVRFTFLFLVILFGCGKNNKQSNNQQIEKEAVTTDTLNSNENLIDNVEVDTFLIGEPLLSAEVSKKKYYDKWYDYEYDEFMFNNIKKISFKHGNNTFDIFIDTIVNFAERRLDSSFQRIRIIKNNEKEVVFDNTDSWILIEHIGCEYDNNVIITDTNAVKIVQENSILLNRFVSIKKMSDDNLLLFAIGYNYPGSGGRLLTIINLTYFEQPKLIFNDPTDLYAVKDLDNDGIKDIIVEHFFNAPDDINYPSERTNYYLKDGRFIKGTTKRIKG